MIKEQNFYVYLLWMDDMIVNCFTSFEAAENALYAEVSKDDYDEVTWAVDLLLLKLLGAKLLNFRYRSCVLMNDKNWKEICERGNNMTELNVTIDMKLLGKKLEMVIEKDGNTAVYDYSDGYDLKEKYMLEQIAGVMAESLDCSCVHKGDLKKDKYLVRYMNKMGIINATCAEGESFAEVAEKFKDWTVIGIERVAEMR